MTFSMFYSLFPLSAIINLGRIKGMEMVQVTGNQEIFYSADIRKHFTMLIVTLILK